MFIPAGYAQFTWRAVNTASGQIFNTSIGATVEDLTEENRDDVEAAFWDADSFGGLTWEGWASLGLLTKVGTSDPSEPITFEGAAGAVGGGTGDPSPPNLSVLVKKLTDRGGRRGRGRMYIPGPQEPWVNGAGQISTDGLEAYNGALTVFVDALAEISGIGEPVLLHTLETDGLPNAITSWVLESMAATQRRRMR